jgi:flagellar hook-associated protein 1 FlgK
MALLNVLQTGKSGMSTAKAGIATSGHNIANASSEGFSRQRVQSEAAVAKQAAGQNGGHFIGEGSKIARVERINDEYSSERALGIRPFTKRSRFSSIRSRTFLMR